ncbi:hypothetical protein TVAG_197460 [Trichomonas vaginalis G3]|uniref:Uncharacterized protein n=1 Tax=Trichomonas vaginalis (strain ATCC PRA-98 / G3) TaxID=412133 RepID=A2EPL6_TRIV3|nr:hypothetical protein TVAGG3_0600280 [Trichomonas vaginalis G3]EAY05445.1 hypothetical protein TVAG_197460 [Trichomonas vaginalis G3]KAI5523887.1 hypothetical protein TVAGG3_0600280 [Trichomonas vaginalis G3]|eukprot:XP_001317668.1 hypothetical protein [Trichomonas vaginalis G3]
MTGAAKRSGVRTPRSAREIINQVNKQNKRNPNNIIIQTDALHLNIDKSKHYNKKSKVLLSPLQLSPPAQFSSPFRNDVNEKNDFNEVIITNEQVVEPPKEIPEKTQKSNESKKSSIDFHFTQEIIQEFDKYQLNFLSQLSNMQSNLNLEFLKISRRLDKIEGSLTK